MITIAHGEPFTNSGLMVADVPVTFVTDLAGLAVFAAEFRNGTEHAADTETYGWQDGGEPQLRVVSAACVRAGVEQAWVIDCRDLDRVAVVESLEGLELSGWNASYDAKVFEIAKGGRTSVRWFDAMLADAVCHQGESGFEWYRGLAKVSAELCGLVLDGKGTTQTSYDESTSLSAEQVRYAALDAIATMRVTRALREQVAKLSLTAACSLEQRARPFLDAMQRHGIPIDWDGWKHELDAMQGELDESLASLADLTGGGQADIFSMMEKPAWKPDSTADVKRILNQWEAERVHAYFTRTAGEARGFEKVDKADKDTLKAIGGSICEALLAYRNKKKVLSTYGDNLAKFIGPDGRMHPEYLQVIGTDTGRLSSRNPNAQNFTPRLKPHFRPPAGSGRVLAYADLSQAELRFLAQVSGDEGMREAFRAGKDIHVATAERMFSIDMEALKDAEPKQYKEYRSKAKTLNFGIVYGLGPSALATSLTLSGVETTPDEAKALLAAYLEAYPGVKVWLAKRDDVVRQLAKRPPTVDLEASISLRSMHGPIKGFVTRHRKAEGREPDADELCEGLWPVARLRRELVETLGRTPSESEVEEARISKRDQLAWARGYLASVILDMTGAPIGFTSYTEVGRQRRFQVTTDSVLLAMVTIVCQSRKPGPKSLRDGFAHTHGIQLTRNGSFLSRDEITKAFEDRALRLEFVEYVVAQMGPEAGQFLVQKAVSDRISAMGNAYRNAPIQGGVADIVLDAYGMLWDQLGADTSVWPVQTVHDSITLECDEADADRVAGLLKSCLEIAMAKICPDVPARADADIRTSLDDGSVLREL